LRQRPPVPSLPCPLRNSDLAFLKIGNELCAARSARETAGENGSEPRYSASVSIKGSEPEGKQLAGLCADCVHSKKVESSRGSVFWLCELSRTDSSFAKYPRLPVLSCKGYKREEVGV
jgi:hypothetical protein